MSTYVKIDHFYTIFNMKYLVIFRLNITTVINLISVITIEQVALQLSPTTRLMFGLILKTTLQYPLANITHTHILSQGLVLFLALITHYIC